jgi:hypothetical protein
MALRITSTGIRPYETIQGAPGQKQVVGTSLQIRGALYPPSRPWIEKLSPEELRDQFNNYKFFRTMTPEQRLNWLQEHAIEDDDLYLEDVPGLEVRFLKIGGDFIIKNLTQEQINLLLRGNPENQEGFWPIQEVYNMFPGKIGSKARRKTLLFRPGNWSLSIDTSHIENIYIGPAIHLESGTLLEGTFERDQYPYMIIIDSTPELKKYTPRMAIIASTMGTEPLEYNRLEILCGTLGLDTKVMRQIHDLISWFTPSPHKSLIQKIIRTRCTHVEHNGIEYPAKEVLATTWCMLISHPGAFVPNVKRFVSGQESGYKRLAISIQEDGYLSEGNILTSLLAGAYIAQNGEKGDWIPSDDLLKIWISYGLSALDNEVMYDYDWKSIDDVTFKEWTPWYVSYYLLASVKSFDSDIKMVASIAQNNGQPTQFKDLREKRVMPLVQCIDQHTLTSIAHLYPYEVVKALGSYPELFRQIWQQVTGINPRKPQYANFDFMTNNNPFFIQTRQAQSLMWLSQTATPLPLKESNQSITIEYTLDPSWLASFIGSVEIRVGHTTAITMINPNDLFSYESIKRPSRDKSGEAELTEVEKQIAIDSFKEMLRKGLPFANVPDTLSMFKGGIVYLTHDDTEYVIALNGQITSWDDAIRLQLTFPVHQITPPTNYLSHAMTTTGKGIVLQGPLSSVKKIYTLEELSPIFMNYIRSLPVIVLQRFMMYLTYNSEIELHHIGRTGDAVKLTVVVEDTAVNELCSTICVWYPGALVKTKSKYLVKTGPLLWSLKQLISNHILSFVTINKNEWQIQPNRDTRPLWDHQVDAVENLLLSRFQKKTRILYIPPGLGKSLIVATYVLRLIQAGTMSKYCLLTLPQSALVTVQHEFTLLGIPSIHLDLRATSKTPKELVPYQVSIVHHDHLRLLDLDVVKNMASDMVFIVDEFHKAYNDTKRTSAALEIAYLCNDTICMSGTIIKDTNLEAIMIWLSQAVNFEVTSKNFWVALSSIIARKIDTKIVVERLVLEAPMNDDERNRYYKVVPSNLGGTSNKIDFKEAVAISYEAISREIIQLVMWHLEAGEIGVFVVARNIEHQHWLEAQFKARGVQDIVLIGKGYTVNLLPEDRFKPHYSKICITTMNHVEGYNATLYRILIMGVYFSNEASRYQVECRINRISQTSPTIRIIILHSGILTYINNHYQKARSLSQVIKGFAREVDIDPKDIDY